jgi:endonuclease YncB( thermonuclease family)
MRRRAAALLVLVTTLCAWAVSDTAARPAAATEHARVARVIDGDTIVLASGLRVRLLQIDTPEPGTAECFSRAAGRALRSLLPAGSSVSLEADPPLDRVDRYGRLLRYVHRGGLNVNIELVRRGAATVWFYGGERGRYAGRLLGAAASARRLGRGLWGACPRAIWDPFGPARTGPGSPAAAPSPQPRPVATGSCDPAYPTVCIPPSPPDLDCADVAHRRFRVLPPDPHRFDGEGDGIGCER